MTTKTDDKERAAFEAWSNGRCELHLVNSAGRYSSATTQFAWEAYQAGRAALAAQSAAATAAPSDEHVSVVGMPEFDDLLDHIYEHGTTSEGVRSRADALARALLSRYGRPAGDAQPAVWAAADTLNSPHPTCISSLAYMSQLDRERGREYAPLYASLDAQPDPNVCYGDGFYDGYWKGRGEGWDAAIAAQNSEDAGDAERYRWLRDKAMMGSRHDPAVLKDGPTDCCEFMFGKELDAAIDAARSEDE